MADDSMPKNMITMTMSSEPGQCYWVMCGQSVRLSISLHSHGQLNKNHIQIPMPWLKWHTQTFIRNVNYPLSECMCFFCLFVPLSLCPCDQKRYNIELSECMCTCMHACLVGVFTSPHSSQTFFLPVGCLGVLAALVAGTGGPSGPCGGDSASESLSSASFHELPPSSLFTPWIANSSDLTAVSILATCAKANTTRSNDAAYTVTKHIEMPNRNRHKSRSNENHSLVCLPTVFQMYRMSSL